ncbi:MAG: hypothetical protein ACT4P8_07935 [Betaproteobacteria bacterium]
MDRNRKDIKLDLAIGLLLLSTSFTSEPQAQTSPPAKVPEIAALMPSGLYRGHALLGGKRLDLTLNIQDSKPGGRFSGTVHIPQAAAPCGSVFPISGDMKPSGAVHIESQAGVARGCERILVLTLAGDDVKGSLIGSEGTYQVTLKRPTQ